MHGWIRCALSLSVSILGSPLGTYILCCFLGATTHATPLSTPADRGRGCCLPGTTGGRGQQASQALCVVPYYDGPPYQIREPTKPSFPASHPQIGQKKINPITRIAPHRTAPSLTYGSERDRERPSTHPPFPFFPPKSPFPPPPLLNIATPLTYIFVNAHVPPPPLAFPPKQALVSLDSTGACASRCRALLSPFHTPPDSAILSRARDLGGLFFPYSFSNLSNLYCPISTPFVPSRHLLFVQQPRVYYCTSPSSTCHLHYYLLCIIGHSLFVEAL